LDPKTSGYGSFSCAACPAGVKVAAVADRRIATVSWRGIMEPGRLHIERIVSTLQTSRVGRQLELLDTTASTNNEVLGRVEDEEIDGLVIFAEHQSAGRGRMGRTWEAPRGAGLLLSLLLIDVREALRGGELCLLTAIAACDAIKASTDVKPNIKWPNDLVVGGRKLGGILIESRRRTDGLRAYAIGIGINCLQQRAHFAAELGARATSLEIESAHAVSREALAVSLLGELDRWIAVPESWSDDDLRREWLAHAEPVGGRICLREGGAVHTGTIIDIDPSAALIVQLDAGGIRAFDVANTTVGTTAPRTTA